MTRTSASDAGEALNEVHLVGRVSAVPETRELPSGDVLVSLRVVVARTGGRSGAARGAAGGAARGAGRTTRAGVDTIDVSCWSGRARQAATRLAAGDVVEVSGALRRRFFRGAGGTASRYEVEAASVRRLARAPGGAADERARRLEGPTGVS